jgi:hypothetical protein
MGRLDIVVNVGETAGRLFLRYVFYPALHGLLSVNFRYRIGGVGCGYGNLPSDRPVTVPSCDDKVF